MNNTHFCTYFDKNYLIKGLALIESLVKNHPPLQKIYVICLDELTRVLLKNLKIEKVETIALHEIEHKDSKLLQAKANRNLVEFYWTLTPTVILKIFKWNPEVDCLTYVDADLYFYSSPQPIFDEMEEGSVLIHEHRYSDSLKYLESNGKFNVGLLCFRKNVEGLAVLSRWREQCIEWCYLIPEDDKMGDQKYLDSWPEQYPQVRILKNIGAGVAPWNHEGYKFEEGKNGLPLLNGFPLIFYHFHAFEYLTQGYFVPVKHRHYPLNISVLRICHLPYILKLEKVLKKIRKLLPNFNCGLSRNFSLEKGHVVIFNRRISVDQIWDSSLKQTTTLTGAWEFCQVQDDNNLHKNIEEMSASTENREVNTVVEMESCPIQLWDSSKTVTNSDELLHSLKGRLITEDIETLCVVGAHGYQEENLLNNIFPKLKNIYLIEALPEYAEGLKIKTRKDLRVKVFECAISDHDGTADFFITDNNGESSSLLKLGEHKKVFPWVHEKSSIKVKVKTLDTLMSENNLMAPDMLFLDVQGAEYQIISVLSKKILKSLKLIYTEVSLVEMYSGAKNLHEIKLLLASQFSDAGYAPLMVESPMHGNSMFIKRGLESKLNKRESGPINTDESVGDELRTLVKKIEPSLELIMNLYQKSICVPALKESAQPLNDLLNKLNEHLINTLQFVVAKEEDHVGIQSKNNVFNLETERLNKFGKKAFESGKLIEAKRYFIKATQIGPENPEAYNNLAVLSYQQNQLKEAQKWVAQCLSQDPLNYDGLYNLTKINDSVRDFNVLRKYFSRALDLNPKNSDIRRLFIQVEEKYLASLLRDAEVSNSKKLDLTYKVSVIVSTYNSEKFMRQCLKDLKEQTLIEQIEIIIIDANSQENEKKIVKEFQNELNNIVYVRTKERIGIYTAWNLAILLSRGKMIMPFSTNDRLKNTAVQDLSEALEANPASGMVYGDTLLTSEPHQNFDSFIPHPTLKPYYWPDYNWETLLYSCSVGPHPMWLKSIHSEIGYFDSRYFGIADQDFFNREALYRPLTHIKVVTGLQWITEDSLSGQSDSQYEIYDIKIKHQDFFKKLTGKKIPEHIHISYYNMFKIILSQFAESGKLEELEHFYLKNKHRYRNESDFPKIEELMEKVKNLNQGTNQDTNA